MLGRVGRLIRMRRQVWGNKARPQVPLKEEAHTRADAFVRLS